MFGLRGFEKQAAEQEGAIKTTGDIMPAFCDGCLAYQETLVRTMAPLTPDQLALRPAHHLRSVGETAAHLIGARARWFYMLVGEGGETFKAFGSWYRRAARPRSAVELVRGLGGTWDGMQAAIGSWTPLDWQRTWAGEAPANPKPSRPVG